MNFRLINLLLLNLMLTSTVALMSCSEFLKGKPEKQQVLRLNIASEVCVENFKSQLHKIANSEATEQETHQVFDCIDKYMSQFQNKVEGEKNPDQFDIQDFLYITNRFFKDLDLSSETIAKIVHLKRALVGGNSEIVTRDEIRLLRNYLNTVVRAEIQLLRPYFKILNPQNQNPDITSLEIHKANQQLSLSLKKLLKSSQFVESQYSYVDTKSLLESLKILTSEDTDIVNIIDRIRQLLLGDQVLTAVADYELFTNNITDTFELYSLSRHGHMKFEMSSILSTKLAIHSVDKIADLLSSSYQFQKTGHVSTHDLDGVLEVMISRKILPFEVTFKTLQEFYKIALKRVFAQETSDSISEAQFQVYRKESALFKLNVDFVETSLPLKNYKIVDLQKILKTYIETKSLSRLGSELSAQDKVLVKNNFINMTADLYAAFPVMIRNDKYLLSKAVTLEAFTAMDVLRSFYVKMLARQLLMGWGNGHSVKSFKEAYLKEEQMTTFKREFRQIGIELKLNDPRDPPTGAKAFLEANLFGFSSDGNDEMSVDECFEYLHYLLTEGSWTTRQIQNDLKNNKCELDEQDVFGNPWSKESCFVNNLKHNYSKYFINKPNLVKYLSQLSDAEFNGYYGMMMDVARFEAKNNNIKIETADIQTFVVLTSYVEAMFVKHDANNNQTLSADEIRLSYKKFEKFATNYSLAHAAESLNDWDSFFNYCRAFHSKKDLIRESFIYMVLNNGRMPVQDDINFKGCAFGNIYKFENEIDRKSIIYTFLVLKSVLASDQ